MEAGLRGLLREQSLRSIRRVARAGLSGGTAFRLLELGLRPERERRGAASHTARGLRALLTLRKGAALDRSTGAAARGARPLTGVRALWHAKRVPLTKNTKQRQHKEPISWQQLCSSTTT